MPALPRRISRLRLRSPNARIHLASAVSWLKLALESSVPTVLRAARLIDHPCRTKVALSAFLRDSAASPNTSVLRP